MPRHRKHSEEGQSGHGRRRKHSGERRRKHSSDDAAQAEQPSASADAPQRPRLSKQLSDSLKSVLGGSGRDSEEAAPPPRPRLSKRASDSLKSVLGGSGRILDPTFERRSVRLSGLSQTRLNGRVGTATSYDDAKGRYRVRLDAGFEEESKLLAFKAENLRMA